MLRQESILDSPLDDVTHWQRYLSIKIGIWFTLEENIKLPLGHRISICNTGIKPTGLSYLLRNLYSIFYFEQTFHRGTLLLDN